MATYGNRCSKTPNQHEALSLKGRAWPGGVLQIDGPKHCLQGKGVYQIAPAFHSLVCPTKVKHFHSREAGDTEESTTELR